MKTYISISFLAALFLLQGCVTEVVETLYIGDVKVNAPIAAPPVHLNVNSQPGDVTISPRFSFTNKKNMRARTKDPYIGTVLLPDSSVYEADKDNLEWIYSSYTFGADMDIKLSRVVSLFGGLSFSEDNHIGGNFGIGLFSYLGDPVVRFDIGFNFQEYKYDAVTVVSQTITSYWGGTEYYEYIFHDRGKETNINPFISMTINSNNDSALINYFCTLGYFTQQLLDYSPHTSYSHEPGYYYKSIDQRPDCTAGFFYLNPGIAFGINKQTRLVLCAKILKETVLQINSGEIIVVPNLQMDFNF